jgi:hypothetical protein
MSGRNPDGDQIVISVQAQFNTNENEHHKPKGDGISETYHRGAEILGENASWGADLNFVTVNTGQAFRIADYNIKASDIGTVLYSWKMDNDSRWDVGISIFATLANGHRYVVGSQYLNIHGGRAMETSGYIGRNRRLLAQAGDKHTHQENSGEMRAI